MPEHIYFPTHIGLLTREHRERIGPALWEFLWCISKTTKEITENNEKLGLVYGGKPVSYMEVANELGGSKSTVKRNFERLEEQNYIILKRTPYGQIVKVKNSKKFYRNNGNRAENGTGTKNDTLNHSSVPKMAQGYQKWHGRAENDHSNKDKEIDKEIDKKYASSDSARETNKKNEIGDSAGVPLTDPLRGDRASQDDVREIAQTPGDYEVALVDRYLQLRVKYFNKGGFHGSPADHKAASELFTGGVPLDRALYWLEERFKTYQPKHPRDSINSLGYCVGFIFDKYFQEKNPKKFNRRKGRQEVLPKWYIEQKQREEQEKLQQQPKEDEEDLKKIQKEVEEYLKKYRNTGG